MSVLQSQNCSLVDQIFTFSVGSLSNQPAALRVAPGPFPSFSVLLWPDTAASPPHRLCPPLHQLIPFQPALPPGGEAEPSSPSLASFPPPLCPFYQSEQFGLHFSYGTMTTERKDDFLDTGWPCYSSDSGETGLK